jgi:type IV pilus assembly protein PilW
MSINSRQHGYTLVELMISVLIGLFIIAGVAQIYISSRAASNLQDRIGNLQENGRFALSFLQRTIRKAGYQPYPNSAGVGGQCLRPFDATLTTDNGASTAASDQLAVCYQGDTGFTDCLGSPVTSGAITEIFSVSSASGVSSLNCNSPNGTNNGAQPLVEGIENMQVLYGVDCPRSISTGVTDCTQNPETAPDWVLDGYADQYLVASSVPAATVGGWKNVVAVRVAVLASSKSNSEDGSGKIYGDTASDAQTFTLLNASGVTLAGIATANGSTASTAGVRARVFTTTIQLRNQTDSQ